MAMKKFPAHNIKYAMLFYNLQKALPISYER